MNNYQLYRTNVKLGGQVAWNLVLEDMSNGGLKVSYFDVTPISPYVDYKYGQNTDCLRYTHQENVRELYKQIKGQFYNACINPELKTIYPILGENKITRDPSLETGCSRISYKRYHKQIQYLCPLWLEDFNSNNVLKFEISFNSKNEQNLLASRSLILDLNNDEYHNKFIQYMNSYVDFLNEGESIGDDLLNINIPEKLASITGIDIASGDIVSKDISNLVPNLYDRERPLMETDYMLIDNYHTSEMICKQLFNFNLVFDVADLVSNIVNNMLLDSEFNIKVNAYVGTRYVEGEENKISWKLLEKKSFDTDYSDIKEYKDILTHLNDVNYIKFTHKNKLDQDICHWTLRDNENYVFNLYGGFSTDYPYFYKDSPNYWDADKCNSLTWCKHYSKNPYNDKTLTSINSLYEWMRSPRYEDTKFSPNDSFVELSRIGEIDSTELNTVYLSTDSIGSLGTIQSTINSLNTLRLNNYIFIIPNYDLENPDDSDDSDDYDMYDFSAYTEDEITQELAEKTGYIVLLPTLYDDHYILFTSKKYEYLLSYKYITNILNWLFLNTTESRLPQTLQSIKIVQKVLDSIIQPNIVYMYGTLSTRRVDSPWITTSEINYIKNNYDRVICIRYDGKIKPKFSDFEDQVWYRIKLMTEDEFRTNQTWQRSETKGFLPYYPSADYYNLEPIYLYLEEDSDDEVTYVYNTPYQKVDEYKWFENSVIFNLIDEVNKEIHSSDIDENYYNNEYLLNLVLRQVYPNLYENHKEYLTSIYESKIDYEYDTPLQPEDKSKFNYIYKIKLTLK